MKNTSKLIEELQDITTSSIKRKQLENRVCQRKERNRRKKEDLLYARKIIAELPDRLRRTAERGERCHVVVHNIKPLCGKVVAKITRYLERQGLKTKQVPDYDPGSDREWTELWVMW